MTEDERKLQTAIYWCEAVCGVGVLLILVSLILSVLAKGHL